MLQEARELFLQVSGNCWNPIAAFPDWQGNEPLALEAITKVKVSIGKEAVNHNGLHVFLQTVIGPSNTIQAILN